MTTVRNVDGLKAHAQQKRQEALEKAEKGIQQLIKEGKRVNFNTVAEAGDVSKAWLYDEPQIRERIEQLRKQSTTPKRSLPPEQKMSDESKSAIIGLHKQKIKKLEEENRKLSEQLQVSYGRVLETERIDSKRERLERENQQLRLERDALRGERDELKQRLAVYEPEEVQAISTSPPKVISLALNEWTEELEAEVESLKLMGIKLSSKLRGKFHAKPEYVVLNAISALKQAITEGKTVIRSPEAWLSNAIDDEWVKNNPVLVVETVQFPIEVTQVDGLEKEELASPDELKALSSLFKELP